MPAEGVLHVPCRFSASGGPVHPCLPKEFFEDETVDVPSKIIPNVYNEAGPVKNRVELPVELADVIAPHSPQVKIAYFIFRGFFNA